MANQTETIEALTSHLQGQLALFQLIAEHQVRLLPMLDTCNEIGPVLDVLGQKNSLLDQVRANNQSGVAVLDEWRKIKANAPADAVLRVETMLTQMERMAQDLRKQDEEMVHRFEKWGGPTKPVDRQEHSRNMLNAFRALR